MYNNRGVFWSSWGGLRFEFTGTNKVQVAPYLISRGAFAGFRQRQEA
jgi:hypothetical protein